MALDAFFAAAEPVVAVRAVHLDLKGTPPTPARLGALLELFAALRYNAVLVEWEDTFPWTVDERFRCETAYTPEQVAGFHQAARRLGIEVIPLVQCLGHMETPLSVPGYEHLRERPHQSGVLNPLAPGARDLVEAMVQDVLRLTDRPRWFHLGGDEAWSFGTHPDTAAHVRQHGKGALYLHHVEPILDLLNGQGIRPILWHDMMRDWEPAALERLAGKADLCVWGYHGHPDTSEHCHVRYIQRFSDHGIGLWGATAYKGAAGSDIDRPDPQLHRTNATAWAEVAGRFGMHGVFATAWSRYSTHDVHCETIDASLDTLAEVAAILHDGQPPAGGVEACLAALDAVGERERFDACRQAVEMLAEARKWGWHRLSQLREVETMATLDARRRSGGTLITYWRQVSRYVEQAEQAALAVREAFAGLVEPLWIERYLAERIEPLREELACMAPRVQRLDPAGWAAR